MFVVYNQITVPIFLVEREKCELECDTAKWGDSRRRLTVARMRRIR